MKLLYYFLAAALFALITTTMQYSGIAAGGLLTVVIGAACLYLAGYMSRKHSKSKDGNQDPDSVPAHESYAHIEPLPPKKEPVPHYSAVPEDPPVKAPAALPWVLCIVSLVLSVGLLCSTFYYYSLCSRQAGEIASYQEKIKSSESKMAKTSEDSFALGYDKGYDVGFTEGKETGHERGYTRGYNIGYNDGHDAGSHGY